MPESSDNSANRTFHCGYCNRHIMLKEEDDRPDHACLNCHFKNWKNGENV